MYRLLKFLFTITTVLIAVLLTYQPAQALSMINQRIKVSGIWKDDKLVVYKLKYRDQHKDASSGRISGQISGLNRNQKNFKLGPYSIAWNENTKFQQLTPNDLLDGYNAKVIGRNNNSGEFVATRIEPGSSDSDSDSLQVLGSVSAAKSQPNGDVVVTVLGQSIVIPSRQISPAIVLTRKQDDRRPDDQLTVQLFGKPLTIGGEIGVTPRYRKNLNLDPERNRDRVRLDSEVQLELFYPWSANLAFFVEGQVNYEQDLYRGNNGTTRGDAEFKRGESWIFWGDILQTGFSLQAGRQNFREPREWWWDDDLDAVRLFYNRPFWHFEVGVAEQLFATSTLDDGIEAEEKDVLRILSHLSWTWASKQQLGVFFLHQHDHSSQEPIGSLVQDEFSDPIDGNATWVGLRTLNRISFDNVGDFHFWADGAWMKGEERIFDFDDSEVEGVSIVEDIENQDFEGWALDIGLTWELPLSWEPSLTVGYAIGTKEFRQTGLHDNNDRFRAVSRFRYYGELLRPELSNLQIWTAAATVPFLHNSSVSVLYHYYRQVDAQPFLRDGRIGPDPEGINPSIGQEWDLVVALEEWEHWELEFVAGVFKAGSAYGENSGNIAANVEFKVNYNF
jgi:hypothetical protein